jgi:hypothetical protein
MRVEYGSVDAGISSCVLIYDLFGISYPGEYTVNLFTQPTGNAGFSIKPVNTGRAFWKLDYYQNLNGQGTFADNASGFFYLPTDSIYKYNFVSGQTDSTSNKHGFNINIIRGETYSAAVDVFVSTGHPRTGVAPVVSFTPNLSGSFATVTGSYDFGKKGTWQRLTQKIFAPSVVSNLGASAIYFETTVATKTASHPYYSSGSSFGFVIGNTQGRTLTLYKGATYVFSQSNDSNLDDEFYISTSPNSGGGSNSYAAGFSYYGNEGFDGYAVFAVPYNAPPILYYNSKRVGSSYVGGRINIVGGYNSGNVGNTGTSGNTGNTSNTSYTSASESYAVCFDPTRSELTAANLNGGYILYKNMQFERNKPMFRGVIHPTKFTSVPRSSTSSIVDATGKDNNANMINGMFDANAFLLFGNRTTLNDGGVLDINLKASTTKTFSIGSSTTQTYDFWFTQTAASYQKAYLFARSSASQAGYFLDGEGYPQTIFIQEGRVYFSFSSPTGKILSGYTQQIIQINNLYNVTVAANASLATGLKVDVYVNGEKMDVTVYTQLQPPSFLRFENTVSSRGNVAGTGNVGFVSNNTNFYCISSYNNVGESTPSAILSAPSQTNKKSISLSWPAVEQAFGYYIYRSSTPSFGVSSLLADVTDKSITSFLDENYQLRFGSPKIGGRFVFNYNENVTSFVDSSVAKVCFGNYPVSTLNLNHFEGYIYRIAIYSSKLSESQIKKNYNSFLYKFISQDPLVIGAQAKPRSVIYKRVRE